MLNTAFIERLNGTHTAPTGQLDAQMSPRRSPSRSAGDGDVLAWMHHELSRRAAKAAGQRGEVLLTPAMASSLTAHCWSVLELLSYRVALTPWLAPKRRGRPAKLTELHVREQQLPGEQSRRRPLLRPRKGGVCSTTS